MKQSLIVSSEYIINDKIKLVIPTAREILQNETMHYNIISNLISTPFDKIVELYDAGIDEQSISDFEFFSYLFLEMKGYDFSLIFNGIHPKDFVMAVQTVNNKLVLYNEKNDIIIDELVYNSICEAIEKIYLLKKTNKRIIHKASREILIEDIRMERMLNAEEEREPYLENMCISLLSSGQTDVIFDYNIYMLNKLLSKTRKFVDYNIIMNGVYSGSLDSKKINLEEYNWLH